MGRAAVMSIVVACCVLGAADRVAAHGDRGALEVYELEVVDAAEGMLRLDVVVGLHHPEDGHPALDATIRLSGRNDAQVRALPVTLAPTGEPGEYAGSVDLVAEGGAWALELTAEGPAARISFRLDPRTGEVSGVTVVEPPAHDHDHGAGEPSPMPRRLLSIAIGCAAVAAVSLLWRAWRRRTPPQPAPPRQDRS